MDEGSENKDHLKFWFVLERTITATHSLEKKAKRLRMVRVFEIIEAELEPGIVESQGARERNT